MSCKKHLFDFVINYGAMHTILRNVHYGTVDCYELIKVLIMVMYMWFME